MLILEVRQSLELNFLSNHLYESSLYLQIFSKFKNLNWIWDQVKIYSAKILKINCHNNIKFRNLDSIEEVRDYR